MAYVPLLPGFGVVTMTGSGLSELCPLLGEEVFRPLDMLAELPLEVPPLARHPLEDPPSAEPPPGDEELPAPGAADWWLLVAGTKAGALPVRVAETKGSSG